MNLALVYKGKIIEVKDNIEELKAIDFECDNYEEILEKIKKDTSKNIEEAYYKFTNPDYFLPESLNTVYEEAIKKIDILNEQLTKEYEYCYKLTVKSKLLNQKLDNIEDNEIQNIITDIQKLLFQMKKIPTINYDDNQKLIEEIYKLVYRGIKLELASKKDSQLLEKIKIDNTDISYVASLIKKDISKEEDKSKQEEIQRKVQEIKQNGFSDIYYLDKELIVMLTSKKDSILISKKEDQILEKIEEYENTKKELEEKHNYYEFSNEEIERIKIRTKNSKKTRRVRKIVLTVNWGLVAGLIALISFKTKPIFQDKEYKTITTLYDLSTDDISSNIEYLPETEDRVTVVEYQPWEEYGIFDTQYKRNIYTYELDISNINYDDIRDYLKSDFEEEVRTIKREERSTSKPNDKSEESEYVITKQTQDKQDYIIKEKIGLWILVSSEISVASIFINSQSLKAIYEAFGQKKSLKQLKQVVRKNKEDLMTEKKKLLETKQKIEKLYNQISNLKSSIEVEYEELPIALKENEKIKRKVLTIKEDNIEK